LWYFTDHGEKTVIFKWKMQSLEVKIGLDQISGSAQVIVFSS